MKTHRIGALRVATLGLTLVGLFGCSAAPTQPGSVSTPAVALPAQSALSAPSPDLHAGSGYDVQQRRGRRYKFRRIVISGVPYFIPYYNFKDYYLPNYQRYDTNWYYVYAYTGRNFSGERRLIRVRRDQVRDRDWSDRWNWNRDWSDRDDWRDGDRDRDERGGRGGRMGRD